MKLSPDIRDSATLKFSELAKEKNRRKEKIISLGIGEPMFDTPPEIVEATYDAMKKGYTKYSDPLGLVELRELIKDKLLKDNGIDVSIDNIVVTPGAKQALSLALMALLEPNDEVINITPCYVSYIPQIKIAEPSAVIHNIDLDKHDHSLDRGKIKKAFNKKTKAIIINSPHNPTGKMLERDEIGFLARLVKGTGCYVVSDEIYEKLNFSGMRHYSIGAVKEIKDKAITINGFSKAFSMTGWRIGYLAAPKELIKAISRLQQHLNTNTCTFIQKGACSAFSLNEDYPKAYNSALKERESLLVEMVKSNSALRLVRPAGGLFAFLDISGASHGSDRFSARLLDRKNVAVIPGVSFGENWDDHVRISLVAQTDEFREGMRRIDEFVRSEDGP